MIILSLRTPLILQPLAAAYDCLWPGTAAPQPHALTCLHMLLDVWCGACMQIFNGFGAHNATQPDSSAASLQANSCNYSKARVVCADQHNMLYELFAILGMLSQHDLNITAMLPKLSQHSRQPLLTTHCRCACVVAASVPQQVGGVHA